MQNQNKKASLGADMIFSLKKTIKDELFCLKEM